MTTRIPALLCLCCMIAACSSIEIRRVDAKDTNGIRFYRSTPYLLVTQTAPDMMCAATVVYYPNQDEEYIIIPHYRLGSLTFNPTLTEGWNLTAFAGTVDTKIPETLTAIGGLVTAGATAGGVKAAGVSKYIVQIDGIAEPQAYLTPGLYTIQFKGKPVLERIFGLGADKERKDAACKGLGLVPEPKK